ncbi:MAG: Hpt domain-containing protein, partial [Rubrivivax sp.]
MADAPVPEVVELAFDDLADAFALAEPMAPFPAAIETDPAIDPSAEPSVEPSVPVDSDPTAADRESASERPVHDAAPALPVESVPTPEAQFEPEPLVPAEELVKVVGTLRIPIPLFNIFLNEADEQSRRLGIEVAEWSLEPHQPVAESTIALAHSIAGNSATVGYQELSGLARAFEHALMRSRASGHGRGEEPMLFNDVADEIRRLLHLFAAGFLRAVPASLRARVAAHESWPVEVAPEAGDSVAGLPPEFMAEAEGAEPVSAATANGDAASLDEREDDGALDDVVDAVDADLFPIFDEEAEELLPQLRARISDWMRRPSDSGGAAACMRTLHTFKGGARLAGALRVGEMAHRLETDIERLGDTPGVSAPQIERLLLRADAMAVALERLRHPAAAPVPAASDAAPSATTATASAEPAPVATPPVAVDEPVAPVAPAPVADGGPAPLAAPDGPTIGDLAASAAPGDPSTAIDWARFVVPAAADDALAEEPAAPAAAAAASTSGGAAASVPTVRVRAPLLDRLVNQAGEVSIARARIEAEVRSLHGSLDDLTENLERLRRHLRDIELQAETQISSRMEAAKLAAEAFDPLEMDRFTRFQEITRMMAESVNDVATVQRSLQRGLQASEDELAMQARLTRDLQD